MSVESALGWTFLNLLTIAALGFFSMEEMACVSFNKIRLQFYVSKGMKRAIWLNYLLQHPAWLFGTTLLGVNAAMFIGSECSRQSFIAMGLNPDLAPLLQVPLVVIFGELAPMFAARRFAENVALLGAPILYATAKILTPILWNINFITKIVDFFMGGGKPEDHRVLNQEELQKILALQDDDHVETEGEELNDVSRNIFSLRNKDARQVMEPMKNVYILPANATVEQARHIFRNSDIDFIPLYHRDKGHIMGIIHPRDIIRVPDNKRLRDYTSATWFITQNTKAIQILKEFRRSNRSVGIILNDQGKAVGVITLDDLTEEIFGSMESNKQTDTRTKHRLIIDRTFPADMTVGEFNDQFGVQLSSERDLTLAELIEKTLHHPEIDESVYIEPFELTVKETTLTEIKKVLITTRIK